MDGLPAVVLPLVGLGDAVGGRLLVGELGEERRKLVNVLARGCSSSSSEASTTFRRRRFAGGAINAIWSFEIVTCLAP